jgi:peptide/nickel transport system substrate-binding protein
MVDVTFSGEYYATDEVEFVRFLVLDAQGELRTTGDAQPVQDGMWRVILTPEQTADLEMGSSRLEVVVVSNVVSIPSFAQFPFVTIHP